MVFTQQRRRGNWRLRDGPRIGSSRA